MRGIIDRFEGNKVLLEVGKEGILIFDKELFPKNVKEGDVVEYIDGSFVVDEKETKERNQYINNLFKSLIDKEK
ncbi:MAG: DUF3006 domain-containing protein [Tissierellia bacterium]|nr:DUF3006 domain-containing protein [Tissierellia bacterium]